MTREKGNALLLTLHLQPSIYCFSIFFPLSLLVFTYCMYSQVSPLAKNLSYCEFIRRASSLCSQNYPICFEDLLSSGTDMLINLS